MLVSCCHQIFILSIDNRGIIIKIQESEMKTSCLEMYVPKFIGNIAFDVAESDEVQLGFDAMLSHEVVKFLTTHHALSKKRLVQRSSYKRQVFSVLDEHELAMV